MVNATNYRTRHSLSSQDTNSCTLPRFKNYIGESYVQFGVLFASVTLPVIFKAHADNILHTLLPLTFGVITGVSLVKSYDILQNREHRLFKIICVALAIFATYHNPLFGCVAFATYHAVSAFEPLRRFTQDYFGSSEMITEAGWQEANESNNDYYTVESDTKPTLAQEDWQNTFDNWEPSEFRTTKENVKAALLENRVIALSVKCFSKIKETVDHYCPSVNRLFHPVDLMHSCLDPKTRRINDLFAKTWTQLKFALRTPVVVAVTTLATFHLAVATLSIWGPLVTGFGLSVCTDLIENGKWLTRISFSAVVVASYLIAPMYTIAYLVTAVAFTSIPSLAKARKCIIDDITVSDLSFDKGKNPSTSSTNSSFKAKSIDGPLHFVTLFPKAWEEHTKQAKAWFADVFYPKSQSGVV